MVHETAPVNKPDQLRAWLTEANPGLRREPERLQVFVDKGSLVATAASGLSFEYRYTLTLQLLDFADHPNAIMAPLLAWIAVNQPELLANPDRSREGIKFEADILDPGKVDLQIEIALTERVKVARQSDGTLQAMHLAEPPFPAGEHPLRDPAAEPGGLQQLYLGGELIAEWPGA